MQPADTSGVAAEWLKLGADISWDVLSPLHHGGEGNSRGTNISARDSGVGVGEGGTHTSLFRCVFVQTNSIKSDKIRNKCVFLSITFILTGIIDSNS